MVARTTKQFNGPAILVAMFRELGPVFRAKLIAKLRTAAPMFARLVDEFEFIFADLDRLDNKSLQMLLRVVPERDWLMAWKLAPEPLRARLLENMSAPRREDFSKAAAEAPKVPRSQVYRIQVQIARQAYELLQSGKIHIQSKRLKPQFKLKPRIPRQ